MAYFNQCGSCPYSGTMISKGRKTGLNKYEIVLILEEKHGNEVEAHLSEKQPVKQKCQSLFT